jgi:glycosyltransferase involved in cell wall biosynthesis
MANPELSILIPAYNEAVALGPVLDAIGALELPAHEIIVIDDGSNDETAAVAAAHGARVIRHPYNIGNGAAVKTGLRAARGEIVLLMDGDGQHPPVAIPDLLGPLGDYHMVVAARLRRSEAGWHRMLANRFYSWFASYVAQYRVEDLTSGFRAVRRRDVARFIDMLPNTFSYPTTLTLAFLRSGLAVKYTPVEFGRRRGESKIRLWQDGTRFLLIISKVATLFAPFRVFLPVSVSFFTLGLGYYAYTFITRGRFTNMAALLLSTSVIIFMMGLVSEQIAQLRLDRLATPPSSGDDEPR